MKTIVFLADGFEECEALIVVDILRRAGIEVDMASIMGRKEVLSSRKITVIADTLAEDVNYDGVDMLILPGGRVGMENLRDHKLVRVKCCQFAEKKHVAAICAAPTIFADLGLLAGKKATCHPDFADRLPEGTYLDQHVVVDGNIITGQALGATFAFAFEIVKTLVGEKPVEKIKKAIQAAYEDGAAKLKGNGKSVPPLSTLKTPLRDGDEAFPDDESYKGYMFLNANNTQAPGIVDADRQPIIERREVYSGCFGRASISFYAFNTNGNKGIACSLNNLQKIKDGTPLGGHSRAEDDFADDEEDFLS